MTKNSADEPSFIEVLYGCGFKHIRMARCRLVFCLVIFLHCLPLASTECGSDGRVVLPVGLFASSDMLWTTAEALPAAELAVQQINEDSDILPGYCIQQKVFSSKVNVRSMLMQ